MEGGRRTDDREAVRFSINKNFDVFTIDIETKKFTQLTTGVGPDLMTGARQAVADMVELLAGRYNMNPVDAYMLVSTCGDLRISEIVDLPNWVVWFYFPRVVLE